MSEGPFHTEGPDTDPFPDPPPEIPGGGQTVDDDD